MLAFAQEATRDLFGGCKIDLRSRRARRTERKAGELQTGRCLLGDIANDIHGVGFRLDIIIFVQDLQAVVYRADRTNHIMANLAGNQSRQLKISRFGTVGHLQGPLVSLQMRRPQ